MGSPNFKGGLSQISLGDNLKPYLDFGGELGGVKKIDND